PRIRVIENAVGSTPAGLNAAIRASSFPIVIRVDAHSSLPADYARTAAEEATWIERLRALKMPFVTVPASPRGAPIAIAESPTLSLLESA
ncbi:hypothetical protein ACC691_39195, partial [Rhizobium johnstonii]